jgi:hypothetical protein
MLGRAPAGRRVRRPRRSTVADSKQTPAFEVHSEARGPHWVAWLTRGSDQKPVGDVIIVGGTREEAESRARAWAADATAQGYL